MKKRIKFLTVLTAVMLFLLPDPNFGQVPNLRTASDFILFTTNGDLGNTGVSEIYGGAIGTNSGAINGFDNVNCVKHINDAVTAQCSLDLQAAFTEIQNIPRTGTITATLLSGNTYTAGVYIINSAVNLTADLTLNAENNPDALFIFNVTGAFNSAAAIKINLLNGALAQNIYWNVDAAVVFGAGASMKGTFLSLAGAFTIGANVSLEGRALTISGAITIDNGTLVKCLLPVEPTTNLTQPTCSVATGTITITAPTGAGMTYSIDGSAFTNTTGIFNQVPGGIYTVFAKNPDGCMSWKNETIKSFGHSPDLGTVSDFILFTTIGAVGNTGPSSVITGGAVGTNSGAISGFNDLHCVQHTQDAATAQCALDLQAAFNEIHNIPVTEIIIAADLSGSTRTAGVYKINSAVTLTSTLTLNAQNNPDALFIFNVTGAFGAAAASSIILENGASVNNIFWNVDAAVSIGAGAHMKGTFLSLAGAIDLADGASLDGRALTIAGAVNIYNSPIAVCIRPAAPTVTLIQPSWPETTGTISITEPTGIGMTYRIDYCTYTNTTGTFTLVPAGTYPVTAKNSDGCISSVTNVTINSLTWTGSISTDWNNLNNWSGGIVPNDTYTVVIPDAYTTSHDPVLPESPAAFVKTIAIHNGGILDGGSSTTITVAGSTSAWLNMGTFNSGTSTVIFTHANATITYPANFYNVTINSGAGLTINAGVSLTVNGNLTNNAGTSGLVIKSASGSDGKLLNNTPSVPATVELSLTGGTSYFHFFVPPVSTMAIGSSSAEVKTNLGLTNFNNDLMSYSESEAGANQNLGWQYYDGYPGPNSEFTSHPFTSLTPAKGYNIYLTAADKITFNGTLNAAPHSFTLNRSLNCLGWNLVGNPYPCNYDLAGCSALTTTDNGVDKSIYFAHNGNYAVWNLVTHTGTSGYSDIVPPMQGFFVHVTASGNSLTFPAGSKTTSDATPRSKGPGLIEANSIEKIKLVLSNSTQSDETIVCLIEKATSGFDGEYDAYKLFGSNTIPYIYTELGSVKYAINSLAGPVSEPVIIPVTVVLKSPGTYKIDVTELENPDGIKVILKHGSVETILSRNTSYSFTSAAGTFTDFELIIGGTATGVENPVNEKLQTWYRNNFLYIHCPVEMTAGKGNLIIYDMQGKPVYNNNQLYLTPGQTIQLPLTLPKGVYVVRVIINSQPFVSKIVIL